jgi:hypothetical protein
MLDGVSVRFLTRDMILEPELARVPSVAGERAVPLRVAHGLVVLI